MWKKLIWCLMRSIKCVLSSIEITMIGGRVIKHVNIRVRWLNGNLEREECLKEFEEY